jgi:hypothetical protein
VNVRRKKGFTTRGEIQEFLFLIDFVPCTIEAAVKIMKGLRYFFLKYPEYADMFDRELFCDLFVMEK